MRKPTGIGAWLPTGLLVLGVFACAGAEEAGGSSDGSSARPDWASSMRALGEQVLDGLNRGDTGALERLRLTEREHNGEIWPELPVAMSGSGYTADLAWSNIQLRNERAVGRNLEWFEGRTATLEDVRCRGAVQAFTTFRVHTDCWVRFRVDDGLAEAQLFKDVVERDGAYKIFRYYDEGVQVLERA